MQQEENLVLLSAPMLPQGQAYLERKGCTFERVKIADATLHQITFPPGCKRSEELWPRVTYPRYHIIFPDHSIVEEQQAPTSILSLPIEA